MEGGSSEKKGRGKDEPGRPSRHLGQFQLHKTMDRIPRNEGGAVVADDSIAHQASPPIVSFDQTADSKTQSAQFAAGVLLAPTSDEDGGGADGGSVTTSNGRSSRTRHKTLLARMKHVLMTFGKFVGPGFMVSVAYSKSLHRLFSHDEPSPCD